MQTALTRSYFGAKFLGYNFKVVSIPDSVNVGKDPLAFDPKTMRAAFDAGRTLAKQPILGRPFRPISAISRVGLWTS